MLSKLTENEVYNYLGLLFVILVVIFVIHKIVEAQTKVIEGMNNKSINELIDKIKDTAKKNREDLHIGEDRSKFEDIIISYKSMIGCSVLKQISTNEDFIKNPMNLAGFLALYNQSNEGFDKLIEQLDRIEERVKKDNSTF